VTFSISKEVREKFYFILIKKFGCTRNHIGESIDEAVRDWIEKQEKIIKNEEREKY